MKQEGRVGRALAGSFVDLNIPRNSPVGIFLAFFAVILGFALIWRIYWLAALGLVGAAAVALLEFWKTDLEIRVPAEQIAAFERSHATLLLPAASGDLEAVGLSPDEQHTLQGVAGGQS
jgi:cytochrome o ubiquinol oxidase subunit 1